MLQYLCVQINLKNIKKFASEILKYTRSGTPDVEEDPPIEGYVNTKIQEKYNLTPKILPVDYADMLLAITNKISG